MTAPSDSTDPLIGQNVNGYVVEGRLGEGGMGLVYGCLQPEIGKRAALKVLRPEVSGDPEIVSRLVSEARAVNAIRHRGIVDIFGYAKLPDGRQAIIMEFLEGRSLEDELQAAVAEHRTLPVKRVIQVADEVLNALGAAHKAGVIHRDLKPSNIFLCRSPNGDEHVKLLDFGIARMGVVNQTKASVVLGTPSYMAPEQARGESVGPALDLYAMGVILFEMLTGRLPYIADNAVRVIYMHLEAPIPRPSSINAALPGALDDIVTRLLAKRTHERFESAEALRRELLRVKVALSDPSALTTIDEPIAPFDSTQPIERTFVRATTPPRPTDLDRTGVLGASPPGSQPSAPLDAARAPTVPPSGAALLGALAGPGSASVAPAQASSSPDVNANRSSHSGATSGGLLPGTATSDDAARPVVGGASAVGTTQPDGARFAAADRQGSVSGSRVPETLRAGADHAVRRSRAPFVALGAIGVVLAAGGVLLVGRGESGTAPGPATPPASAPVPSPPPSPSQPPVAIAPVEVAPPPPAPSEPPGPRAPVEVAPTTAPATASSSKPEADRQDRSLERRVERLARRLQKVRAGGGDTDVAERQLAVVRSKLATATTDEARGQLEAILDRIANDLEAP